ncbi:MAG: hypothetical protein ACC651_13250 [Candidatus Scalindua sp.]
MGWKIIKLETAILQNFPIAQINYERKPGHQEALVTEYRDQIKKECMRIMNKYNCLNNKNYRIYQRDGEATGIPAIHLTGAEPCPGELYLAARIWELCCQTNSNNTHGMLRVMQLFNSVNRQQALEIEFKAQQSDSGKEKLGHEKPIKKIIRRLIERTGKSESRFIREALRGEDDDLLQDVCLTRDDPINYRYCETTYTEPGKGVIHYSLDNKPDEISFSRVGSTISEIKKTL